MLIAVAALSVTCSLGHRAMFGTLEEQKQAVAAAKRGVDEHALYDQFEATRIRPVGVNPRRFRVDGIADGKKPIAVFVVQGEKGFTWEYIETDHTRD